MSPARPTSSKRNPTNGFKPYTRGVAPIGQSSPDLSDSKQFFASNTPPGSPSLNDNSVQYVPLERPGFPTYAQYKQVEAAYIQSLTPRRQGKALISQAMFDRIWDVLHQPESSGETAQFRFWARKMFTLSKTHRSTLNGFETPSDPPQEVLLHDNLLVAIQEQLYDLLCYCHGTTGHGGRDKTCALIRKHYTWVPKDLVSSFIKACPTCIMKKCGNFDSALASQMAEQRSEEVKFSRLPDLFASYPSSTSPALPVAYSWPTLPTSDEDAVPQNMEEIDPIEAAYREAVQRARSLKASLSGIPTTPQRYGSQRVAMSREVSLYKGLPNGWQYRYDDYASAHAEFMKTKGLGFVQDVDPSGRARRPRIPSILPLWNPEQFMQEEYAVQDTNLSNSADMLSISPLVDASQQQDSDAQNSASLQYLLGHPQQPLVGFEEEPQPFAEQIDPLLLQLSTGSPSHTSETVGPETNSLNQTADPNDTGLGVPMSVKRAAAPPRLQFDFSTAKAFSVYRSPLREADITPDSPLMSIDWDQAANLSPTRSDSTSSSGGSQLSMFVMPPMSATTTISPASSALRTPVDEFPSGRKEEDHIGAMKGTVKVEPVELELSGGIEQVCEL